MTVGQKIKRYIEENGLSQTFVSRQAQIPLPKLNLSLNGNRRLTFEEYELICGVLNVETGLFLEPRKPSPHDKRVG